jgi:hypothetical protein
MKTRDSNKAGTDELRTNVETPKTAKLNRDIQAKLGDQLRQMYNDVVSQGVPDRFADLLAKLGPPAGDGEKGSK